MRKKEKFQGRGKEATTSKFFPHLKTTWAKKSAGEHHQASFSHTSLNFFGKLFLQAKEVNEEKQGKESKFEKLPIKHKHFTIQVGFQKDKECKRNIAAYIWQLDDEREKL